MAIPGIAEKSAIWQLLAVSGHLVTLASLQQGPIAGSGSIFEHALDERRRIAGRYANKRLP